MTGGHDTLLEVRGVSKHYGGTAALSDCSISVGKGEIVGLVGDNGAGKSTLVRLIAGIEEPDAGEIRCATVDGVLEPVTFSTPLAANAAGIQTVYQDLALCDNLDTVQNLFLGREVKGTWSVLRRLNRAVMERRAQDVLVSLGARIPDLSRPVGALSGGQRQCVAICRAILSDPAVVILDEPTAALGVTQTKQVVDLVDRLRSRGCGVILVSHDMNDVEYLADKVVVLRLGRDVFTRARGEFHRNELLGAITGMAQRDERGVT